MLFLQTICGQGVSLGSPTGKNREVWLGGSVSSYTLCFCSTSFIYIDRSEFAGASFSLLTSCLDVDASDHHYVECVGWSCIMNRNALLHALIWCACFLLSYPVKPLLYVCASPILLELWNLEVSWCEFHATMRPWSGLAASSERCENCQSISPVKFPLQYLHVSYPISSWKFQHGFWKMLS